ncbi:MAG: hypothetical protein HY721_11295 [Planctomycetes bacterium]|nr:hypothetical protein [Planctomycetota bacterium]
MAVIRGSTVTSVHMNPHIDYSVPAGPVEERDQSLAFPLGMEIASDGETLYAAAFGSRKVAVLDKDARVLARIPVGGGPSGLALDEGRGRLYILNRFDQTVSIVDTRARLQVSAVPLRYDPEPPPVRSGRRVLYDASRSGHGDAACASCHVFADFDSLAWDLGDPGGAVEDNPLVRVAVQGGSPLADFHPMKGPMTTQSLRGMAGAGAMHWRGDRNGGSGDPFSEEKAFLAFRPAFQGLLGMDAPLPVEEMERFRDFILTVRYPPNPIANLDGTLTPQQAAGKQIFDSNGSRSGLGGDGDPCASCHALPLGTDGHGSFEILTQDFKVAHLRNLYQKVGMYGYALPSIASDSPFRLEAAPTPHTGDQVRGFGFLHDGAVPNLFNFFRLPARQFTFPDQPGRSGSQKVRELEAFLLAFPTGLAPAVGQQVTLDQANIRLSPSPKLERYVLLRARADAGECDLAIHGPVSGVLRGYVYRGGGAFDSDRTSESRTESALSAFVAAGDAVLTVTAVPPGCGRRIGIDRDEDGWRNLDEVESGSDPADPSSIPCPPAPAGLTAEASGGSVALAWQPAASPLFAIDGYNVHRSGDGGASWARCNGAPVVATSFTDEGVPPGPHAYRVTALGNGKEGPPSEAMEVLVGPPGSLFLRGDCEGGGELDISDAVFGLAFLFTGGALPPCLEACDSNGDGEVDISDAVHTLLFLFAGGAPPGLYPECEPSAEADCAGSPGCA